MSLLTFTEQFSDKVLNLLLESLESGVYITDFNGCILWANKSFSKITGYSFEEIIGQNPRILKSGYHGQTFYEDMWKTISSGDVWHKNFINKRKNGTHFFQETTISPVKNGKVTHFIAIIQDITTKKNTEKEIRNSEKLFRTLFYTSPLPTSIIDIKDLRILKTNNEWENLYELARRQMHLKENFHFWKNQQQLKEIIDKIKNGEEIPLTEFQVIRKDGSIRHCIFIGKLIEFENQLCVLSMTLDITEKINYENKLLELTKTLREAYNDLEDFTYIASHDLKEPLRKIKVFSDLLSAKTDCENCQKCDSQKYIYYLSESSSRTISLINDLLDFSKTSQKEILSEAFSIKNCIEEVICVLDEKIKEKNVKISISLSKNCTKNIYGDKILIQHVFQNLIDNAIKFNDKKQIKIKILCKRYKKEYIFTVKDNGIGIEQEYLDKIFDPLKRLYSQDKYPGSGIGLSICKKIIEKHHGKIWAESKPGEGSCFNFTIGENI